MKHGRKDNWTRERWENYKAWTTVYCGEIGKLPPLKDDRDQLSLMISCCEIAVGIEPGFRYYISE